MQAFIINDLPERILFPSDGSIWVNPKEYFTLTGNTLDSTFTSTSQTGISVNYKGFNGQQVCAMDLVISGKLQHINFGKLTVPQVRGLLKL